MQWRLSCSLPPSQTLLPSPIQLPLKMLCTATRASRSETGAAMALDRTAACQSWICSPCCNVMCFMVYVLLCWGVFFSVLRLYSKWSIVWGLKNFFSSSLSSCKKLYFLNTLSPVLSTPLSYVCCVCMDRLMANFAGTCTSDNKGLLLLLLKTSSVPHCKKGSQTSRQTELHSRQDQNLWTF